MADSEKQKPNKPTAPIKRSAEPPRKPLQVMHISRKEDPSLSKDLEDSSLHRSAEDLKKSINADNKKNEPSSSREILTDSPLRPKSSTPNSDFKGSTAQDSEPFTMADLLRDPKANSSVENKSIENATYPFDSNSPRSVDDFDFDEDAFLAALDENEPIGTTGEIATGKVIATESDGVYVDIGGKAPGFMPKNECGLGVITNIKEKFPNGLEVEVLVTRDQNADGMVTISCRALALRKSWEKVKDLEKEGKVVKVKVNGFNRGGVTCDLEGLRGFIPRSQLEEGENHEKLVGKNLGVSFLEVNPDTRKLVLSEKRAAIVARFSELEVGQLITGKISAIKPYGFFVDLGGVSGLLHHSMVTNGSMRSLREVFDRDEEIKALITELDPARGRIGLNTALLEGPPGELLVEKNKIMLEAEERAKKAANSIKKPEEAKE